MADNILEVRNLKKYFKTHKGNVHAVDNVSFTLERGKTLGIVGESGCGKSTTGRTILRLIEPTSGEVYFEGKDISKLSNKEMTKLRKDMQRELKNIQKQLGITFIFVTHDQEEALSMSDTVVVMDGGRIQQVGTPTDIYNEPVNAFVADFIGESNILDGVMPADYKATFAGHTFDCLDAGFAPGEAVDVVIRPEDVDIVAPEQGMLTGTVTSVTFLGVHYEIIVDIRGFKWMIQTTDYCGEGETVGLFVEPDAIHIMKKSEYSGRYGDYSTFSDEMEEINQISEEAEDD